MSPTAARAIEVEVRIEARPATVFPYFTDADRLSQWQCLHAEIEPRPGGLFREMLTGRTRGFVRGEFLVVEPPHRVVYTWGWENPIGYPPTRDVPPGSSTVEITLVPDGDATIVRVRHSGLPNEAAVDFHRVGWDHVLARLAASAAGAAPAPYAFADR